MRNLLEHPVTTDEIVDVLQHYIAEENAKQGDDPQIGNPTVLVLEEAIRRVRSIRDWYVSREDERGNPFVVRDGLSQRDAGGLKALFEARGHKQTYFVRQREA